jgi:DNA-binding NarL/FixJ family response regulator
VEFTLRETQIAERVVRGKLNKEIAFEIGLTEGTIKAYLFDLYKKVGVTSRTGLAVYWVKSLRG